MSYTKTTWVNNAAPAINATNLNKIENGIATNDTAIGDISQLETTATDLTSAVNENKESIDTLTSTLQYNLITGGSAIKTGRKIDGKDEYVKRIECTNLGSTGVEKTYATGIDVSNSIITNIDVMSVVSSGNWFQLPNADTANCFISLRANGILVIKFLTQWFEGATAYVNIYYIEND